MNGTEMNRDRTGHLSSVVPERITMALDLAGMEGPACDAALGVAEPTVDLWERGELVPTPVQIKRLALATGLPVRWFYRPAQPVGRLFACTMDDKIAGGDA